MQIILMHPRLSQARSVTLTGKHIVLLGIAFVAAILLTAGLLYYCTLRFASEKLPFVGNVATVATQEENSKKDKYVKENLNVMAVKLGQMQAQLARLDALGERVQGLSGVKPEEFNFKELPGRGGIERNSHELNMEQLQLALGALSRDLDYRADYMNVVETALMSAKVKSRLLPTIVPVNVSYNASGFGWRLDPFSGRSAFHEGIDFPSPNGTPIVAAAGGVIIASEYHPQFGNMVEIDHGNDIFTRYAHASRVLVKVGDIVKRGQHVADIGSTGRSTGSHLHFEVHVKGIPQDPHKFLAAGADANKMDKLAQLGDSAKK
jgi:murein DD-endopeptidase MepM/ murein hydrolase activator NlpD